MGIKYILIFLILIITFKITRYSTLIDNFVVKSFRQKSFYNFYGGNIIHKLKQDGYPIIVGNGSFSKEEMPNIYKKCFIGLRLVPHDGIAYQVQELGLMGIKTIHNGDSPAALNYSSYKDIIKHINNEKKLIGTKDTKLARKIKKYITMDANIFNLNLYFPNVNGKFQQIYISKSLNLFKQTLHKKYPNLQVYNNPKKSAIFFGVYTYEDLKILQHHNSYGLIIWGGSDTWISHKNKYRKLRQFIVGSTSRLDNKRFYHISQSSYIQDDLNQYNIPNKRINFNTITQEQFNPVIKGRHIYAYCPTY